MYRVIYAKGGILLKTDCLACILWCYKQLLSTRKTLLVIFVLILSSDLRAAGLSNTGNGTPSSNIYHSQFQLYGLDFFYASIKPSEVFNVLGNTTITAKSDDFNSSFMFCYRSNKDNSGLVFRGIANRIESVMMIRNINIISQQSINIDACKVSSLVSMGVATKGGLSLTINKKALSKIFKDDLKYDEEHDVFKVIKKALYLTKMKKLWSATISFTSSESYMTLEYMLNI